MQKRYVVILGLVLVASLFLFTSSCAKKKAISPTPAGEEGDMGETSLLNEGGDQGSPYGEARTEEEVERLRQEQARQERLKKEAEERMRMERRQEGVYEGMAMEGKERFVNEDIYYDFDSSTLSASAQEKLNWKAEWLSQNPEASVIIEGHCDERGTNEYNLALGERRAESAKTFMVKLGVSASRLMTVSYGEERPVDPGHTEDSWAKNRRAHFVIQ